MKFTLVFLLSFLPSLGALAAFNEALTLKQVTEDGSQFVFVRREGDAPWNGITIKDPHTKAILYEAKVIKCSATACIGVVVHNHSGIKLRTDEEYVHSYNETPIKVDGKELPLPEPPVEPTPEPEVVKPVVVKPVVVKPKPVPVEKKKEAPKKPSVMDSSIYASYGSPIGPGFKLGYFKQASSFWLGLSYANISSVTNNVSIKGHLLSGIGSYTVFQPSPSIDLNIVGELGMAKATLDFTGVDIDGPIEDEATYFYAIAGEGKLNLGRLSLALKSGMSKTGFAASYTGEFAKFTNPYGTMLVFLEIGAYYRF
jgi:hypothetical protein